MPLDFLFRRSESRRNDWRDAREIRIQNEPRLELPAPILLESRRPDRPPLPTPVVEGAPLPVPDSQIRVRHMSPRQMADWAHEMYMMGWIAWEEYRAAIPTELHPDYDTTIGALTGEPAQPDRPRDMVREMEERLEFARRHFFDDDAKLRGLMRIVSILRWQDAPQHFDS
jgi:hypothetical protein